MKQYILFSLLIVFASCSHKVETVYHDVEAMRASSIYRTDSVSEYLNTFQELNKKLADSYFEKAEKEKETNAPKAVYFYKRAITLYPSLSSYKALAEVLFKLQRYNELRNLYSFLNSSISQQMPDGNYSSEYIFGKPDEDLLYEYLFSNILLSRTLWGEDIYTAREEGYNLENIKKRLVSDKRLPMDTSSFEFKNIMIQFLDYEEIESEAKKPSTFSGFLASIKDTASVFEITDKNVQRFNYTDFNGINEYDGFQQRDFSSIYVYYLKEKQDNKDSWIKYNFNYCPKLSPLFHAVVYAVDTSEDACPREMRHVYHRLVTYDPTGQIIDSKVVAWQSGEELVSMKMDHTKFWITEYNRTWKKPYKKTDFDNDVVKITKGNESAYEISAEGKIVEVSGGSLP
jgi:hypothetical protein